MDREDLNDLAESVYGYLEDRKSKGSDFVREIKRSGRMIVLSLDDHFTFEPAKASYVPGRFLDEAALEVHFVFLDDYVRAKLFLRVRASDGQEDSLMSRTLLMGAEYPDGEFFEKLEKALSCFGVHGIPWPPVGGSSPEETNDAADV